MSTAQTTGVRYLYRQRRKYWARFGIPEDVRDVFGGNREHWVNLETDHLRTAEARVHRAASAFHSRVREARGRSDVVVQDALHWRKVIEDARGSGGPEADYSGEAVDAAIAKAAEQFVTGGYAQVRRSAALFHDGSEGDALLDLGGAKAKAFVDVAIAGKRPLAPFVSPWAAVRATEVEPKTAAMDRTWVSSFVEAFPLASDVKKAAVAEWITKRRGEVSAATVQRGVSGIRSFWAYLQDRGEVSADLAPFAGHRFKDRRKAVAENKRVAFKAAEVSALYEAALGAKEQHLADLIALAAYTGARREELCVLKVGDVADGWLSIRGAKTDAGDRDVPVHNAIAPVLTRLIGKRKAGYVLEGLEEDQWGHRGDALGKRFTRLKAALGHGSGKTFHSIRHTLSQLLRGEDVTEDLVADVLGHKLATMTGGRYGSREARRKLLPAAMARVQYPKPL